MEKIIQEKISADHLLYVSLKYTKTTDVMLNLLARWKSMIDLSIEKLLLNAKKKRIISAIPSVPKLQVDKVKEIYKKDPIISETLKIYEFFKRVDKLEKIRENEFRKNVCLKVLDQGKWETIDIDKLKEYSALLEKFISNLKQAL
ncbi:hypothetical protein HYW76_02585 [Candidatus Pacearchaeota archaeon]|nr:hypothetical protein [Candidatus Pacearchaeota archaeon]